MGTIGGKISDELDRLVEERIAAGEFKNRSDVVRVAVERLLQPPEVYNRECKPEKVDNEEVPQKEQTSAKSPKKRGRKKAEVESDITPTPISEKDSKGKSKAQKFYGPDHYRFDASIWAQITEGVFPPNERYDTLVIGAYLLAMEKFRDSKKMLRGSEFSGKHGANVKRMLEYFAAYHDGDMLAGFREALKYVKWFVQSEDPFLSDAGWPIELLFATTNYRERYTVKASGQMKYRRKGALANNNVDYVLPEDRLTGSKGIRL